MPPFLALVTRHAIISKLSTPPGRTSPAAGGNLSVCAETTSMLLMSYTVRVVVLYASADQLRFHSAGAPMGR